MKKLLLILLCLPMIGFGQGWTQIYPGSIDSEYGQDAIQTSDGGYITCSDVDYGNGNEIRLIKTDASGNLVWVQTFGATNPDYKQAYALQQTTDGGYIIFASKRDTSFNSSSNALLIKTDASGNLQWSQTYNDISLDDGDKTSDGGYVFVGKGPNYDLTLTKVDLSGNLQWSQQYLQNSGSIGYSVQQTTDGGYFIGGEFMGSGGGIFKLKIDQSGNQEWFQTFQGNGEKNPGSRQTSDGGYISCGDSNILNAYDIILIKTDGSGNQTWSQNYSYGTNNLDAEPHDFEQTSDGGYIILASFSDDNGIISGNCFLLKTDGIGNQQWSQVLDFDIEWDEETANSVQQTTDGGYIISGGLLNSNGDIDACLVKTDSQGNTTSTFNIPINPNRKLEKVVDILGRETKAKTNTPLIEIYDDGTVEKRIVIE